MHGHPKTDSELTSDDDDNDDGCDDIAGAVCRKRVCAKSRAVSLLTD